MANNPLGSEIYLNAVALATEALQDGFTPEWQARALLSVAEAPLMTVMGLVAVLHDCASFRKAPDGQLVEDRDQAAIILQLAGQRVVIADAQPPPTT